MTKIVFNGNSMQTLPQGEDVQTAVNLTALNDVTVSSPVADELLVYTGGIWRNRSLDQIGGGYTDVDAVNAIESVDQLNLDHRVSVGNTAGTVPNLWFNANINPTAGGATSLVGQNSLGEWPLALTTETQRNNRTATTMTDTVFINTAGQIVDGAGSDRRHLIADNTNTHFLALERTELYDVVLDTDDQLDSFKTQQVFKVSDKASGTSVSDNVEYTALAFRSNGSLLSGTVNITAPNPDTDFDTSALRLGYTGTLGGTATGEISLYSQDTDTTTQVMEFSELGIHPRGLLSNYNYFQVSGAYEHLVRSIRAESNPARHQRSRTSFRVEVRAEDSSGDLVAAQDGFGCDVNYTVNDAEVGNTEFTVYDSAWNTDGTLDRDNTKIKYEVTMRGQGNSDFTAHTFTPWESQLEFNAVDESSFMNLTTNAQGYTTDKPWQFQGVVNNASNYSEIHRATRQFSVTGYCYEAAHDNSGSNLAAGQGAGAYGYASRADNGVVYTGYNAVELGSGGAYDGVYTGDLKHTYKVELYRNGFAEYSTGSVMEAQIDLVKLADRELIIDNTGSTLKLDTDTKTLEISASDVNFSNLPTSDPLVAGRLWNDAGTMKISAG